MFSRTKKLVLTSLLSLFILSFFTISVFAQMVTPTPSLSGSQDNSQQIQQLSEKIKKLQDTIGSLRNQENSLSSEISVMDNEIKLSEYRIDSTRQQISQLSRDISIASKQMSNLEGSLTNVTRVLINRIVATYQVGSIQPIQILFASNDVSDFLTRESYLKIVQEHDKQLIFDTQQTKNDYANQKTIFENKRKQVEALQLQLQDYTKQLDQQKGQKQKLLADTQGNEEVYQHLLSQAEQQLAGFSRFAASQGGASLLDSQTFCDDWGCYYNQRDSQWGAVSLDNTKYSIASDGCLLTSMAMIYTHYGHKSVTPLIINGNPSNFASYEPAWLLKTIVADGASSTRVGSQIDSELGAGRPVIVGISYDGGPLADHFVVLISGSGGSYQMNDPFTPNGHNISFTSHYAVGSIREIDRISI